MFLHLTKQTLQNQGTYIRAIRVSDLISGSVSDMNHDKFENHKKVLLHISFLREYGW